MESTKEVKLSAISQHMLAIMADKYTFEVALLAENTRIKPDKSEVDRLQNEISIFTSQIEQLEKQYKVIELE